MEILISQTASLGDVILSTPLIAAVRHKHPQSEVWFLSSRSGTDLLKADKRLTGLISFDKNGSDSGLTGMLAKAGEIRKHNFDLVYAVQRSARVSIVLRLAGIKERAGFKSSSLPFLFTHLVVRPKNRHDVERNLALLELGADGDCEFADITLTAPDKESLSEPVRKFLELSMEGYLAIFPGSLWNTKRWKPENFAELGKILRDKGQRCLFLGSASEEAMVRSCADPSGSLSLAGKTSLQDLIYLVSGARAVICNDSSALHIASAFRIPTLAIFCATSEAFGFGPWRNPNAKVVEDASLWCKPCSRHGGEFCPTGTEFCMSGKIKNSQVSVENVSKAVFEVLNRG